MVKSYFKFPFSEFRSDYSLSAYVRYYKIVKYFGIVFFSLLVISYVFRAKPDQYQTQNHIARVDVGNLSSFNSNWVENLTLALNNDKALGVVLVIDQASSGHGLFEVESAISVIRKMKNKKPVVTFVYGYALGGNYVLASETSYIIAQRTATLGGLSVAVSSFDPKPLLQRIGVDIITKGYGDLKIMPEKDHKNYDAYMKHRNDIYRSLYQWMLTTVTTNRNLEKSSLNNISQGQWYLGERAMKYGLCDEVGDIFLAEDKLRMYLGNDKLPFLDYSHGYDSGAVFNSAASYISGLAYQSFDWVIRSISSNVVRLMSKEMTRYVRHVMYL